MTTHVLAGMAAPAPNAPGPDPIDLLKGIAEEKSKNPEYIGANTTYVLKAINDSKDGASLTSARLLSGAHGVMSDEDLAKVDARIKENVFTLNPMAASTWGYKPGFDRTTLATQDDLLHPPVTAASKLRARLHTALERLVPTETGDIVMALDAMAKLSERIDAKKEHTDVIKALKKLIQMAVASVKPGKAVDVQKLWERTRAEWSALHDAASMHQEDAIKAKTMRWTGDSFTADGLAGAILADNQPQTMRARSRSRSASPARDRRSRGQYNRGRRDDRDRERYTTPRTPRTPSYGNGPPKPCRDWNGRGCTRKERGLPCSYPHKCTNCNAEDHGALHCKKKNTPAPMKSEEQ